VIFVFLVFVLTLRFGLVVPESEIQVTVNILRMEDIEPGFVKPVFIFALTVIEECIGRCGIVVIESGRS
jgi:multisubunit Na+/H+ antiporter MnhE subunit